MELARRALPAWLALLALWDLQALGQLALQAMPLPLLSDLLESMVPPEQSVLLGLRALPSWDRQGMELSGLQVLEVMMGVWLVN